MAFPALLEGLRNLARGFRDGAGVENKGFISDCIADAPPLELKSIAEYYDAGWLQANGYYNMAARLGWGQANSAQQPVNLITAQNLSSVWAGRRLICSTYASLPFQLVQRPQPGKLIYRDDLPIWNIMRTGNDERSAKSIRETMTGHLLFAGNAYAKIVRRSSKKSGNGGTAIDLQMLVPEQVLPERERGGQRRLKYTISQVGQPNQTYFVNPGEPQDILHIRGAGNDGLVGYSFLAMARQTLGSSLAMENNLGRFWAHGARKPYYLKTPMTMFTDENKANEFREKWFKKEADASAPLIVQGALELHELGMSMEDAQFLETRIFSVQEFARWLGIPPPLLFDLSNSNYATLEPLVRVFINFGLQDWIDRWTGDFERCVLTPEEKKQGIHVRHSLANIEKGDFLSRCQGYAQMLVNGVWSRNEVREKEGDEPKPGLDGYTVQMQVVPLQPDGTTQMPSEIEMEEDDDQPD